MTPSARVIHYDRNLGKGYAVQVGRARSARPVVSFVDADLDLDPAPLAGYLRPAEAESLDVVIGSKRHPDSHVHYPRFAPCRSWLYQQLVRVLFDSTSATRRSGSSCFGARSRRR